MKFHHPDAGPILSQTKLYNPLVDQKITPLDVRQALPLDLLPSSTLGYTLLPLTRPFPVLSGLGPYTTAKRVNEL